VLQQMILEEKTATSIVESKYSGGGVTTWRKLLGAMLLFIPFNHAVFPCLQMSRCMQTSPPALVTLQVFEQQIFTNLHSLAVARTSSLLAACYTNLARPGTLTWPTVSLRTPRSLAKWRSTSACAHGSGRIAAPLLTCLLLAHILRVLARIEHRATTICYHCGLLHRTRCWHTIVCHRAGA